MGFEKPVQDEKDKGEMPGVVGEREGARDTGEDWNEYGEQEQPPWEDFAEKIDESFKRKKPSPEVVEKMNGRLLDLGKLFEGSELHWHLDGALNISLMNGAAEDPGKYIGEHKDVDISVEKDELEALEVQLHAKGYGLFLSRTDDARANKIMKRVGFHDFSESTEGHRLIAAIDDKGKIRRDKALNFIDVHIVKRDEAGIPLGVSGTPIPEKWTEPQSLEFHGTTLQISHPGKVLYFKLHQGRNYDKTDVMHLIDIGKITEEDIEDVERVYEEECVMNIERGRKIFAPFCDRITSETNADQIFDVLQQQPSFKARADLAAGLRRLAEGISESSERSLESILSIAIEVFGVNEQNDQKRKELGALKRRVEEVQKIRRLQRELA